MALPSVTEMEHMATNDDIAVQRPSPSPSLGESKEERRGRTIDAKFSLDEKRDAEPRVTVTSLPDPTTPSQPKSRLRSLLPSSPSKKSFLALSAVLLKFARFTGPGSIISVAYIDPDNFQTAITSGALLEYKLLCMILVA